MSEQLKCFLRAILKRITVRAFRVALGILFGAYISNAAIEIIAELISGVVV